MTAPAPPAVPLTLESVQDQAARYLRARYGEDYVYRAPETFSNVLERWIWAVAAGSQPMAEESVKTIEEHLHGGGS